MKAKKAPTKPAYMDDDDDEKVALNPVPPKRAPVKKPIKTDSDSEAEIVAKRAPSGSNISPTDTIVKKRVQATKPKTANADVEMADAVKVNDSDSDVPPPPQAKGKSKARVVSGSKRKRSVTAIKSIMINKANNFYSVNSDDDSDVVEYAKPAKKNLKTAHVTDFFDSVPPKPKAKPRQPSGSKPAVVSKAAPKKKQQSDSEEEISIADSSPPPRVAPPARRAAAKSKYTELSDGDNTASDYNGD